MLTGLILLCGAVPALAQALTWSVVPSPNRGTARAFLNGVSCVSVTSCTAVGTYTLGRIDRTLIESWDGARWSVVPSPNRGNEDALYGVSCTSATACTAVGVHHYASSNFGLTLIESWNGSSWSVVPSPNRASYYNQLVGASCASETTCTAVGSSSPNSITTFKTLIESETASG